MTKTEIKKISIYLNQQNLFDIGGAFLNVKRRIALSMLSAIVLAMVAFGAVSCGGSGEAGADGKSAYEIWL